MIDLIYNCIQIGIAVYLVYAVIRLFYDLYQQHK